MNKSESKYYNTSLLMNQALIELLNKKSFEFITIKEICKKAGVNRSTFYLHYDNVNDLLCETIDRLNQSFLAVFNEKDKDIEYKIKNNMKDDLILITPKYLLPYLNHVKENKVVYQVATKYPTLMQSIEKYQYLQKNVLFPIFENFKIPSSEQDYIASYYIKGTYAIIEQWIKKDCQDDVNKICDLIIKCVRP